MGTCQSFYSGKILGEDMRTTTSLIFLLLALFHVTVGTSASESETVQIRTGSYNFGQCYVEGSYVQDLDSFNPLDTQRVHPLGSSWNERCRNCTCNAFGAWCTGPTCNKKYDFTQEKWCVQWSEDECCCEKLGCTVDNEKYELGDEYPYGRGNPCLTCTCEIGTSRDYCLRQKCGTYDVICEDGEVTYDDDCCPHFTCPLGVSCDVIPDPFPKTSRHELVDWYGSRLEAIPVGMTQHFHIDSWNTYVCTCPRGGTATCRMETYTGK